MKNLFNLSDFELLAQEHGFTLAQSINMAPSKDDVEPDAIYLDIFRDVTDEFGVYLFSICGGEAIDISFIDSLLDCYRLNPPTRVLWQYIDSVREKGRGVDPTRLHQIQPRLEEIHDMFWKVICEAYLTITPNISTAIDC